MNSFWQFAASVIALVVLLLIVGLIEKRRTVVAVAPAPAPKTFKEALLPYALWLVILGVVAIVGIGYLVYAHASSVDWKLSLSHRSSTCGCNQWPAVRWEGFGLVDNHCHCQLSCLAWDVRLLWGQSLRSVRRKTGKKSTSKTTLRERRG